ncbi:methyl-accepting chemotaxis protein [Clostridium sp. DL1XJH146]
MKSIKSRIISIVVFSIVLVSVMLSAVSFYSLKKSNDSSITSMETQLRTDYDTMIKSQVEIVVSQLDGIYSKIETGVLTEDEAKLIAADTIRSANYGEGTYFWADTVEGDNIVLLGNKDVEGTNRIDLEDSNGDKMVQKIIEVALDGGGYTDYYFPRSGETEAKPKRSYSKLYEPFGWVIGTGNYIDDINTMVETKRTEANEQFAVTSIILFIILIIAIIVGVIISLLMSKSIANPINKLLNSANSLAEGDLDIDIDVDVDRKDEIGKLAKAFKSMSSNMNDVLSNINVASVQVSAGASQVADSSTALSQGATEQASSVEQLTATMEEITSQTKQNAENTKIAEDISETTKENASNGNKQMKQMLKSMDEINEASKNISKIVKVIDDIAFQTNILALNAAVEAARAGQHGRGFAVVAEEVRNLAGRSADAAKETTELIEGTINKVEEGTSIASETAVALNEIVEGITKVAGLVQNISTASNEQAVAADQINNGLLQISDVVQTNSATSEETAAASEELSSQAEMLREHVSRFKLKENDISNTDNMDSFNPEVLKMLDNMNDNSKSKKVKKIKKGNQNINRIELSDGEFGKY